MENMEATQFAHRLKSLKKLTPNDKKLVRYLESEDPGLVFENLQSLSVKVGVSKSAVSRFIARLGYESFYAFMRELRDEMLHNLDTPLKRHIKRESKNEGAQDRFYAHLEEISGNLRETMKRIEKEDLRRALDLLCKTDQPLYMIGCASAESLIYYFYLLMKYLRGNVILLDGNAPTIAHRVDSVNSDTTIFAMSFAMYPALTADVISYFRQKGSQVILLTDRLSSPMLDWATVPMIVHAEGSAMFKTRCSAMAVIEGLLDAMAFTLKKSVPARYEAMHDLMRHLKIYLSE